jgi:hypothetical protein
MMIDASGSYTEYIFQWQIILPSLPC